MTAMSGFEVQVCRSAPWTGFARRVVLPWATSGVSLDGHGLEIGGGSGAMADALLRRHVRARLTVTDVDPRMVETAAARLAPLGARADVALADATALPYDSGTFDFACSWLMLHHTVRWPAVLSELTRVVRPGGRLVGYDLSAAGVARFLHRGDGADRLVDPADLGDELAARGWIDRVVAPAVAGQLMRFTARHP